MLYQDTCSLSHYHTRSTVHSDDLKVKIQTSSYYDMLPNLNGSINLEHDILDISFNFFFKTYLEFHILQKLPISIVINPLFLHCENKRFTIVFLYTSCYIFSFNGLRWMRAVHIAHSALITQVSGHQHGACYMCMSTQPLLSQPHTQAHIRTAQHHHTCITMCNDVKYHQLYVNGCYSLPNPVYMFCFAFE